MPFRLAVPRVVFEAMVAQARAERPNECCGLLAGLREMTGEGDSPDSTVGRAMERYPLPNALASPVEYESDGRALFDADRDMRRRGLEMLAVYHSHPTTAPVPSRTDLARNYSSEVVNLIISLATEPPTVRGWWLMETEYREAEWIIV
jgi:proteasome lid subunit RPN8/RPN11